MTPELEAVRRRLILVRRALIGLSAESHEPAVTELHALVETVDEALELLADEDEHYEVVGLPDLREVH